MTRYCLTGVEKPPKRGKRIPVALTDATMDERLNRVIGKMDQENLDVLVIYGDLEHGSNFEYLTGFLPRFEEGILVLHRDRTAFLMLGNENTKMVRYSRIPAGLIHVPFLSLPNQPMKDDRPIHEYFADAGLLHGQRVGMVGWKMFTSRVEDNRKLLDLPAYLTEAVKTIVGGSRVANVSHLFIGSHGVRTTNNANEIAHYEFGAALAGDCMADALEHIRTGMTEMELGAFLNASGQRCSVVTIAAAGERFENGNLYPGSRKVKVGDKVSLTVGYKGGLSSRAGYAVEKREQLPKPVQDYVEQLAGPYFAAVIQWLESIRIGMTGGELYRKIQNVLPKETYNWSLNPGHLTGDEEWMSSPIYQDSEEVLKSGMMLQIDIIPGKPGYGGAGCESGIVLADRELRAEMQRAYPQLYHVFMERRNYIKDVLHIQVPAEVLPMSDMVAFYRPYFLNRELAFVKETE
jgi:Xaa-Pro aminopeptidase